MIVKTLNRAEAQSAMKDWILNYPKMPEVEREYLKIREDIQNFNQRVRGGCPQNIAKKDYCIVIYGKYTVLTLGLLRTMIFGGIFL